MSKPIVDFWERFELNKLTNGSAKVHPDDKSWMDDHWQEALGSGLYTTWEEYAEGKRFGLSDKYPHLSLMPVPYMGNITNAKVLLFLANPGFDDGDYFLDFLPGMRERLQRNIRQEEDEYPFIYLDPSLAWSGAYQWWNQRFKPLIERLLDKKFSPQEARRFLAQKIAVIELFPYHSVDGNKLKGIMGKNCLPSVSQARKLLAESSHVEGQLKVLLRGHKKWDHAECASKSAHYIHSLGHQTITLNTELPWGAAIWETLASEL